MNSTDDTFVMSAKYVGSCIKFRDNSTSDLLKVRLGAHSVVKLRLHPDVTYHQTACRKLSLALYKKARPIGPVYALI